MNDEQFLLANAYLDGELTDEDVALAEADPEVMAEVEQLRALQNLMRDVDRPSDAARNAAIAAAMAQFTAGAAIATSGPPAPAPIPFRPRPSYTRYLAVAAGILGVGLLGVAVANLDTGGDDDSADMAAAPASEEPADEPAASTEDADTFVADDTGDQITSEMATEELAEEPASALADESAEDAAEQPAQEPATDWRAERPTLEPGQPLTTPEELGSFGTDLLEEQQAGTLGATPNHACPVDDVLGRAEYVVDGVVVPVLVAVDEPAGIALAVADGTCDPVAEGPLYLP
jgi:hypothetical protein